MGRSRSIAESFRDRISGIMNDGLVSDLLAIHHAITRGLRVSLNRARSFLGEGFPDPETKRGFLDFAKCTVIVTVAHHDTEDDLIFPEFRRRLPEAPFDALDEQHEELLPLLDAVTTGIETGRKGAPNAEWLPALAESLEALGKRWRAHIDLEEKHFSEEAIGRVFSSEEQETLGRQATERGQKLAQPGPLVLPFLLFNLEPEERAKFSAKLPPQVTQQLVPGDWAETWAPMKPFLLS
jgi:hemerythrin-like domain-containing protein